MLCKTGGIKEKRKSDEKIEEKYDGMGKVTEQRSTVSG